MENLKNDQKGRKRHHFSNPKYRISDMKFDTRFIDDSFHFIKLLNTLKLDPQFYYKDVKLLNKLNYLISTLSQQVNPYFVAQCIVWSRCCGKKLTTINHLSAALFAPFTSGLDWAKRFYSSFDVNTKSGGCIYKPDDMLAIKSIYESINKMPLTNAMKKGFADTIERLDTYSIFKYKNSLIDIINLSHPSSKKSNSVILVKSGDHNIMMKSIDALMKGYKVSNDQLNINKLDVNHISRIPIKLNSQKVLYNIASVKI